MIRKARNWWRKQIYRPKSGFFRVFAPWYIKNRDKAKYVVFYYYNRLNALTKGKLLTTLIWDFNIEFTSYCNLNCRWCILNRNKDGYMDEEFLKKLLDKVICDPKIKVMNIALHHGGDALMHPKFEKLIQIIADKKKRSKKFPRVYITHNATLLTKKRADFIIGSGGIDLVRFSIDGGTKEKYESIRIGAKWEKTLANVNYFLDANERAGKKIETAVLTLVDSNQNPNQELSEEFKKLIGRVDRYIQRCPHNWQGQETLNDWAKEISLKGDQFVPRKGFCELIFLNIVVLWDGRVVPCCIDINARGVLGDLNKDNFLKIYHGKKRQFILKKMKKNKRNEIKLCEKCEVMFG